MENKIQFIEDSKNKKMKLTRKLQKIDIILNDKKVLQKEFEKNNQKLDDKNKIKTVSKYKKLLTKKRRCIKRNFRN